jgi:paraquat-inducible protein B
MSQEQAERALQQLYEDVSTRDELSDEEADVLLRWGEAQINKLADANMDDSQFDEAFANLTRMMTRMNRFAARRAEQAPDEQQETLNKIVESASAAGVPVVSTPTETPSAQAVPSVMANLQALLAMFTPQSDESPSTAIVPTESEADSPTREIFDDEEEQF